MYKITKKDAKLFSAFQEVIDELLENEYKHESLTYSHGLIEAKKALYDIIVSHKF